MTAERIRAGRSRRGMAMVMALATTAVLVALAMAMAVTSALEARQADNFRKVSRARLAAESGLAHAALVLRAVRLPAATTAETLAVNLHAALSERLGTPPTLSATNPPTVTMPTVTLGDSAFTCVLTPIAGQNPPACRLTVEGVSGGVRRRVSADFLCIRKASHIFNHGVSSRGRIVIKGSAHVEGILQPADASILSTCDEPVAIEAGGHAEIDGDLYIAGDEISAVVLSGGGLEVGGETSIEKIFNDHVHVGTVGAQFPDTDTSVFAALATNIVDANTDTSGGTFTNIRIKAGTNPTFSSDTVINGVIYVEAPNRVKFAGSCTVNGVIATEDGTGAEHDDCTLTFAGNVDVPGPAALPDWPEYEPLKQLTGTALLAPGFGVEFKGASNGFNGVIAADQISFLGNSGIAGEVKGTVVGLGDREMVLSGNASIRIRGSEDSTPPAGFIQPWGLEVLSATYREPLPTGQ